MVVYLTSFVTILIFSKSMLKVFPPASIFTTLSPHSVLEKSFSYLLKKSSGNDMELLFEFWYDNGVSHPKLNVSSPRVHVTEISL